MSEPLTRFWLSEDSGRTYLSCEGSYKDKHYYCTTELDKEISERLRDPVGFLREITEERLKI